MLHVLEEEKRRNTPKKLKKALKDSTFAAA
jgi:hypothetical protein